MNKYNEFGKKSFDSISERYNNEILSLFPTLFHKWFLYKFADPTMWYENRQNYIKTCAVWSMLGHISFNIN